MAQTKYITLSKLSTFLDNLTNKFSPKSHTHKVGDVVDYEVDEQLSAISTNPVQNRVINDEFDAVGYAIGALELAVDNMNSVPNYTTTDNGKFLRVVNGSPAWSVVPNAEEATF